MEVKFHKAKINIIVGDITADGYKEIPDCLILAYGDTGLGVSRYDLMNKKGRYTSIVHVPTGRRIGRVCATVKQAQLLCRALAPMADWKNITANNVPNGIGVVVAQVRECIESHGEGWKLRYIAMRLGVSSE